MTAAIFNTPPRRRSATVQPQVSARVSYDAALATLVQPPSKPDAAAHGAPAVRVEPRDEVRTRPVPYGLD